MRRIPLYDFANLAAGERFAHTTTIAGCVPYAAGPQIIPDDVGVVRIKGSEPLKPGFQGL